MWLDEVRGVGRSRGTVPTVLDGVVLDTLDLMRGELVELNALVLRSLSEGAGPAGAGHGYGAVRAFGGGVVAPLFTRSAGGASGWGSGVDRGDVSGPVPATADPATANAVMADVGFVSTSQRSRLLLDPVSELVMTRGLRVTHLGACRPGIDDLFAMWQAPCGGATASEPDADGEHPQGASGAQPSRLLDLSSRQMHGWPLGFGRAGRKLPPTPGQLTIWTIRTMRGLREALREAAVPSPAGRGVLVDHALVRQRLASQTARFALANIPRLVLICGSTREWLLARRPRVVVTPDVTNMVGRAVLSTGSQLGIRTVAIEAEAVRGGRDRWSHITDLTCVRDESSRRAVLTAGVTSDQVMVGVPHLHDVSTQLGDSPGPSVGAVQLAHCIEDMCAPRAPRIRSSVAMPVPAQGLAEPDAGDASGGGEAPVGVPRT